METLNLIQGSAEWHAHRAQHFNASDAAAMLGCSPYTTRTELLTRMKTGLAPDIDEATQRRFDEGHRAEALARPIQEEIIGEELYPVTGCTGELSASFDGLTMLEDTSAEHKNLNDEIRAALPHAGRDSHTKNDATRLPKLYRVQQEQQLMVSGATRSLFSATKWNGDALVEERHCWYTSDPALRAEIVAGWAQFAQDLATFIPADAPPPKIVAETVEALPAPVVQVTGHLALKDNFKLFEERLRDFLEHRLIRAPKTDEDFVNLDAQIKAMKQAREALSAAEAQMLAQVQPVDHAKKTKDMLDKLLQQNVSMAEGLLKNEKERRRGEVVAAAVAAFNAHLVALNTRLGKPYMPTIPVDFAGCVKGLKSITSMEDKVNGELARAKIAANEIADRIQINMRALVAAGDAAAFPDAASLVLKAPDDLLAIIAQRVAETERRLAEQREQIRQEEQAKAEKEARDKLAAEQAERDLQARRDAAAATPAPTPAPAVIAAPAVSSQAVNVVPMGTRAPATAAPTLTLGAIKDHLAPFSVTAEGLRQLGFEPAGRDRAAVLYQDNDLPCILTAAIQHMIKARDQLAKAA
jgi:putative phage-type endonuclease